MNTFEKGFRKASRKVAQTAHPTLTLSAESVKLLSQVLSKFNDVLVEECRDNFKPGDGVMREQSAQKAVEKLLKGQLRNMAISNAHRTLALHSSGLLDYTPKAVQVQKKKKKGEDGGMPSDFVNCVGPLCKLVDSELKIKKEAKDAIAEFMFQMSKSLVGMAQTSAEEVGELTANEVIKAVDFYMKPNMAKHAISEGNKNTVLFMSGIHYYTEEDFAAKTR